MIEQLPFGRSGHRSSRVIFGGYALSQATRAEADRTLDLLLSHGINHIDTAPLYGKSEERIGPWMETHRGEFFLATKTRSRGYKRAWQDLQRSLERLRVDSIDLWQMHGLTNPVGWEKAMGPGGALEALLEARDQGLVRFLGVTGHGSQVAEIHQRSLERFDFDSVLLPYNYGMMQISRYANDLKTLLGFCQEQGIALQTIKSIARRPWEDRPRTHNTYFYEPLETQAAIDTAVHWSLGLKGSFLITAGDLQVLPKMLNAASRYEKQPPDAALQEMAETHEVQPIFSY